MSDIAGSQLMLCSHSFFFFFSLVLIKTNTNLPQNKLPGQAQFATTPPAALGHLPNLNRVQIPTPQRRDREEPSNWSIPPWCQELRTIQTPFRYLFFPKKWERNAWLAANFLVLFQQGDEKLSSQWLLRKRPRGFLLIYSFKTDNASLFKTCGFMGTTRQHTAF